MQIIRGQPNLPQRTFVPPTPSQPRAQVPPPALAPPELHVAAAGPTRARGARVSDALAREHIFDPRLRLMGLIPLGAFVLHFVYKQYVASPPRGVEILWMCHVAALLQGIGLVASWSLAVRVASAWAIIGLPNFFLGVLASPEHLTNLSWFTHLTLPVVAVIAMSQVRMDKRPLGIWVLTGLAFYLAMQGAARLFTPAVWNINLAFAPWEPLVKLQVPFMAFWAGVTGGIALLLTTIYAVFRRFFPQHEAGVAAVAVEDRVPIAAALRRT